MNGKRTYVTICVDRLYASIEQPVLITRCVFHTLLQLLTVQYLCARAQVFVQALGWEFRRRLSLQVS